jgi:hypothetical protein
VGAEDAGDIGAGDGAVDGGCGGVLAEGANGADVEADATAGLVDFREGGDGAVLRGLPRRGDRLR